MPASDVLISIIEKIADVISNEIGYENMRILYKVQLEKDVNARAAMNYNRELYMVFNDIISSGIEKKVFRHELSADETARQLMMTYRGLVYEWNVRYPEFDLKAQASKLFNLLLAGISI